jgi:signal transduction histidine kinase
LTTSKRTNEERNIKRVVLLGSTFVVFIVSIVIAYLLISSEIESVNDHIKSFETTLIEREKFTIKTVVENLVTDIRYEKNSNVQEVKHQVKKQSIIAYNLALSLALQNSEKNRNKIIKIIKEIIKSATNTNNEIDYFIFDGDGTLLLNTKNRENEGKNFIDFKDINEKSFIREIVKTDGFVEYSWYRPNDSKIAKKITYSKKIPSLGITIGSGSIIESNHTLSRAISDKIEKENFSKDEFIFLYNIKSLNNIEKSSQLILEKNIKTDNVELETINKILIANNYKADVFYSYDNKLIYATYLPDIRTFISTGVYLNSINKIIEAKTIKANEKLNKKILSLVFTMFVIASIFFMLSYVISKKIERMFKNYRIKIARNQQLLIQKSKMASMGEMIGNIAHQWRQPLSQLSGLFFDIESAYDYKELDKKYLTQRSDEANDLIEYMSKTINDFKEFYNPNTKKEKFHLLKTVQSAIKIVDSSLEFHNIKVSLHVDSSLHVEGFSNEFSQVILNLISNSKDIALFRDIKEPKIKIFSESTGDKVSLHVEDNCGGIDKENIEKIFEPYFTTKYEYGTGIGLYMCKVIIENKMGAKIFAKNIKDGSQFTIEGLHA